MRTVERPSEKRPGPGKVQLNFVVPGELRYGIKLSALRRGMTIHEYPTDIVTRVQSDAENEEAAVEG